MATEQDDKVTDILNDMQAEMTERQAAHYVRRVKHGRAAIAFVALIYAMKLVGALDNYDHTKATFFVFCGVVILYSFLFILSSTKAFIGLRIAAIAYLIIVAFTTIMEAASFAQNLIEEIAGIQHAAYLTTILVRIALIYFLLHGMRYAKKFEALYDDEE